MFTKLLIATMLPAVVVVATASVGYDAPRTSLVLIFGVAHVPTTFALYADPDLRSFLRSHQGRCLVAPILLVAGAAALYVLAPQVVLPYLIAGFVCWQLHHFTKQNLGMVAFWCRANGLPGSDQFERRLIIATGVAGMCGIAPLLPDYAGGRLPLADHLWSVGALLLLIVGVVLVGRADPSRRLALAAVAAFFLPLFLFPDNLGAAVYGFGVAHGAQYYLMVGHLAVVRRWMLPLVVGCAVVGYLLMTAPAGGLAAGAVYGVTMSHFVVDAGLWKMRDPEHRAYMRSRFSFL